MKNQKIVNIRAIAIMLVVLGHSMILYSNDWNVYTLQHEVPTLNMIKNLIDMIQMPIFFSISGFLFYYSVQKKRSFVEFFLTKISRLLIPYWSIGLLYMFPIRMFIGLVGKNNTDIIKALKDILLGKNNGHLWFLYTLFMIFLIMWFVDRALNNWNVEVAYFILFIVFSLLTLTEYKGNNVVFGNTIHYLLWFYYGYLINKYNAENKKNRKIEVILGIICIICCLTGKIEWMKLVVQMIVILLAYEIIPDKKNKYMDKISKNSFGIYLFHSPLIYVTCIYLLDANPILIIFINVVLCGALSYFITLLIRKTKIKFVIGE